MTGNRLRPVEKRLVDAVKSGNDLDLSGQADIERTLRATVLRDILLCKYTRGAAPDGLRLRGALIKGDLDLTGVQTDTRLTLTDCRLSGLRLNGADIPEVTLNSLDWGGSSERALDPVFRVTNQIAANAALMTALLFTFLVAKVMYVARGDITTALGVFDSAGLTTVIVGGLLSSLPLVAAGVLGITIFALTFALLALIPWFRAESEFEFEFELSIVVVSLVAAFACFFLATWEILIVTVAAGATAGLVARVAKKKMKYTKMMRIIIVVVWGIIFVASWLFIVQPMMYAVWLPHEQLVLTEGHSSPEVGYVLDNSNGWVSLLRSGGRRIVRIPSDYVMRRSLCHVDVLAGSQPIFDNPNTGWHNLASITGGRLYIPTETDVCPPGQSGSPSSAG
jgi:hypothetical protein